MSPRQIINMLISPLSGKILEEGGVLNYLDEPAVHVLLRHFGQTEGRAFLSSNHEPKTMFSTSSLVTRQAAMMYSFPQEMG